jgi:hypothetical protein
MVLDFEWMDIYGGSHVYGELDEDMHDGYERRAKSVGS